MSVQSSATVPRAGFVMIDNEAIDSCDLSPRALSLYVILSRHVNRETGLAWPSIEHLCRIASMARATVVKYLKELESKGWIQVLRSFRPHSHARAVNQYRVLNPKRDEAPAPPVPKREPPPIDPPAPAVPEGSSNLEQEVVQTVNEGSSNPEQEIVHGLNGNQTDSQKDLKIQTEMNQKGPALRAEACDTEPSDDCDRSAAPFKAASSPREKHADWNDFCRLLADVCQIDFEANQGKIRKIASRLWRNGRGYTATDLKLFKTWWYKSDWRGVKGDLPTLQNVSELIRAAVETPTEPEKRERQVQRYIGNDEYADIIRY
jgi:hypothetical protein